MIQCYRTDDYPADTRDWDAAGLIGMDYLIGEEELIGRGLGSAMISAFVEQVVRGVYSDARGVVADPEVANLASIGALRRAGFREHKVLPTGEYGTPEQLMVKVYDETPG
jgi:RimJ/RimL family protein N-acetyltransferase